MKILKCIHIITLLLIIIININTQRTVFWKHSSHIKVTGTSFYTHENLMLVMLFLVQCVQEEGVESLRVWLTLELWTVDEDGEEEDTPSSRPRQPSVSVYAIRPPEGCQAIPHTVKPFSCFCLESHKINNTTIITQITSRTPCLTPC